MRKRRLTDVMAVRCASNAAHAVGVMVTSDNVDCAVVVRHISITTVSMTDVVVVTSVHTSLVLLWRRLPRDILRVQPLCIPRMHVATLIEGHFRECSRCASLEDMQGCLGYMQRDAHAHGCTIIASLEEPTCHSR